MNMILTNIPISWSLFDFTTNSSHAMDQILKSHIYIAEQSSGSASRLSYSTMPNAWSFACMWWCARAVLSKELGRGLGVLSDESFLPRQGIKLNINYMCIQSNLKHLILDLILNSNHKKIWNNVKMMSFLF